MRGTRAKVLRKLSGYDVRAHRNYTINTKTGQIRVYNPNHLYYKHMKKQLRRGGN